MIFLKPTLSILIVFSMLFFTACESNNIFRSEKKVKSQIQGTWKLVYPISEEHWTFDDGIFYVSKTITGITERDTGIYKIETTWKEPYVTITEAELINSGPLNLNGKWTIIELDNNVLFITIRPAGSGLEQREFIKE